MGSIKELDYDSAFSENDKKRFSLVHPPDWKNPEPKKKYHLVVIGGGTAGLITAAGAAGLGANVALIERHNLGGDCLNVGCVPSKGLISAARMLKAASNINSEFGITSKSEFNFEIAMERMRKIRSEISQIDGAERYQKDLNVDVFIGQGAFKDENKIIINETTILNFKKAVIATGGRAFIPPIKGLVNVGYRTNATIFDLKELPKRIFVIGGGPIGCELAQSFSRFGSMVTLADLSLRIMKNDDEDAAEIVHRSMESDGVVFKLGAKIIDIEERNSGKKINIEFNGNKESIEVDEILVAAGRSPNIEGLNLEKMGIDFTRNGIAVDKNLRTNKKNIYACGDIATPFQFTHIADATARIVIQNSLFFGNKKWASLIVPWATYTQPEVAHVGKTQTDLEKLNILYDEYKVHMNDVDRALLEGDTEGYVSITTAKGTDKILGATIVSSHAGEMINEISVAMQAKKGLNFLSSVIHPYPTQAEAIRKAGDLYNKTKLTPFAKKILRSLLSINF